jgi:hypothetical protein
MKTGISIEDNSLQGCTHVTVSLRSRRTQSDASIIVERALIAMRIRGTISQHIYAHKSEDLESHLALPLLNRILIVIIYVLD